MQDTLQVLCLQKKMQEICHSFKEASQDDELQFENEEPTHYGSLSSM